MQNSNMTSQKLVNGRAAASSSSTTTAVVKSSPTRTTRRLPPYLSENYVTTQKEFREILKQQSHLTATSKEKRSSNESSSKDSKKKGKKISQSNVPSDDKDDEMSEGQSSDEDIADDENGSDNEYDEEGSEEEVQDSSDDDYAEKRKLKKPNTSKRSKAQSKKRNKRRRKNNTTPNHAASNLVRSVNHFPQLQMPPTVPSQQQQHTLQWPSFGSYTNNSHHTSDGIDYEAELQKLLSKSSTTELCGTSHPQYWRFPTECKEKVDKSIIDQILGGCYYEPGKIVGNVDPSVEICFCFDTTGSMFQCLGELKFKLQQVCQTLLGDLPNIRIAMIAHGDYCDGEMFYVMKKMDFTNDFSILDNFVNSLKGCGGGDPQECYEMALMEIQKLSWSTNSTCAKVVVMIGDDVPHSVDESWLKINWREQLHQLKEHLQSPGVPDGNLRLYSIQCLNRGVFADTFYQEMADKVSGQRLLLDRFESITEIFMGLCYRESAEMQFDKLQDEISQKDQAIIRPKTSSSSQGDQLSDDDIKKIHEAIHDRDKTNVNIRNSKYEIAVGKAGCRFVSISDVTYIEQNKEKNTKYAKMAAEGKKITWIVTKGLWGLIIDSEVVRRGAS